MNKINLVVFGSDKFFNIINELKLDYVISKNLNSDTIKEGSVIKILFVDGMQIKEVKRNLLENHPLIIFLTNKDYIKKNNLTLLNFHVPLSLPVEILPFIEICNILYTKSNFFKKSKIIINGYEIDSNQRVIMKNGIKTKLTEKELDLILILNKNNGLEKNFLLKNIWNRNSDLDSHAFETHLHRLRKKINKFFKDKKFITESNSLYYLSK